MKKLLALLLAGAMLSSMMIGCSEKPADVATPSATPDASKADESKAPDAAPAAKPTEITVVTSYGGDDGNRVNYENAYKAYETATGNTVKDNSGTAVEEWKAKVLTDFQTGAEPDVLFYYNGVDSNSFVEAGKVVDVETIRATYPEFASNMKDGMLGASPVDGKNYSIPVNGYWEALYVNKKVLADAGVEVPSATTTWDQFMADCKKIADKGYTPIAMSLQEVPHYWFEFCVYNSTSVATHPITPKSSSDAAGKAWTTGLNDIKSLYESGFLPKNTTTAKDPETFQLMADNKAAFAIDGSWKLGWFEGSKDADGKDVPGNVAVLDDYTVTYVPAKGERKPTDIIGGLSMGYYITKKAWDNPEKQAACVDFVTAMTSDTAVASFGATAITALKNGVPAQPDAKSMTKAALEMMKGATGISVATQDGLLQAQRDTLWTDVKNIALGKITAEAAIDKALAAK